ncbi:hypothetical protein FF125_01100 [Aureibaculum algae]|uniref:Protein BatD n=1 Tax=Aureibaculum algae TaxID=2584122 RepID=A0A5B7TP06_9FLAO|nr:hypothetical protein [Aureibaculum algae]QCX37101.1 hypothetical protein FF125_01100 [Aureibaculum algae]
MKKINKIFNTKFPQLKGASGAFLSQQHLFVKKTMLLLVVMFSLSSYSQTEPEVSVKVDTTIIRIGEQINYQITVDNIDTGVTFPELRLDPAGKIEIVEDLNIDTLKNRLVRKYLLTSFDSGSYTIPQQKITVWSQEYLTDSVVVDVSTVAVDTLKQSMFPIKSVQNEPYTFDDFKSYLWWILGGLALIALILYFVFRKKETEEELEAKIPPYQLALKRLKELDDKQLWQKNKIKQYYVELTEIVRLYIERELKIPALESTTNELMETIMDFNSSSSLNIPSDTINKLQSLLKDADLVKFAKYVPLSNEIELHRNTTSKIIEDIKTTKPEIVVNKPKCSITNGDATETVTLYRWVYHIFYYGLQRVDVKLSPVGKELHLRRQSYFWKIINEYGRIFSKIPFLNGLLILAWIIWTSPILLLVVIIETIFTGRFLDRGMVFLKKKGVVTKSTNSQKIKDKIDFIKNDENFNKSYKLRKRFTRVLIILSFLFPFIYFGSIYIKNTYFRSENEKRIENIIDKVKKSIEEDEAVE